MLFALWLGAWFAASAVAQILPRQASLRSSRLAWSLPEWRFFAPHPSIHDYFLFHRHFGGDMQRVGFTARGQWAFLLNPAGRRQKAFRDIVDSLQLVIAEDGCIDTTVSDAVCRSVPYMVLLAFAAARQAGAEFVQFGIARRSPGKDDEIVFVSRWHSCQ